MARLCRWLIMCAVSPRHVKSATLYSLIQRGSAAVTELKALSPAAGLLPLNIGGAHPFSPTPAYSFDVCPSRVISALPFRVLDLQRCTYSRTQTSPMSTSWAL